MAEFTGRIAQTKLTELCAKHGLTATFTGDGTQLNLSDGLGTVAILEARMFRIDDQGSPGLPLGSSSLDVTLDIAFHEDVAPAILEVVKHFADHEDCPKCGADRIALREMLAEEPWTENHALAEHAVSNCRACREANEKKNAWLEQARAALRSGGLRDQIYP